MIHVYKMYSGDRGTSVPARVRADRPPQRLPAVRAHHARRELETGRTRLR